MMTQYTAANINKLWNIYKYLHTRHCYSKYFNLVKFERNLKDVRDEDRFHSADGRVERADGSNAQNSAHLRQPGDRA